MPLVGGSSSDAVILQMKAQADQMIDEINRANKELDKQKAVVKAASAEAEKAAQREAEANKKASLSITDFRSAYQIAMDVVRAGQQVFNATFGEFEKYAGEVRDLSIASGTTAEQASRLLQVMDDYQLTAADATAASRKLKDNGLVPTVETLAKLSDEFLAIQDPAARLKFAQDNLGRSASAYYNILNQGSKVILDDAAAIDKHLILTDEEIRKSELERLALDNLGDAWKGLKVKVGEYFGQIILNTSQHEQVIERLKAQGVEVGRGIEYTQAYKDELKKLEDEQINLNKTTDDLTGSQAAAAEQAKALTDVYNGLISATFAIQGSMDSYQKAQDDAAAKDADLGAKKKELTDQWRKEEAAGRGTVAAYDEYVKKMDELSKAQADNADTVTKAKADLEKAANQRVADLVKERLGADGVITSGEFEFLEKLYVQKGLVSQAAADQAIAESKAADQIVGGYENQASAGTSAANAIIKSYSAVNQTLAQTLGLSNAITTSFDGSIGTVPTATTPTGGGSSHVLRDSGGYGMAGQTYMIGTGAQPELFTPSTNGSFTPANQQGSNKSVVINIGSVRNDQDIHYIAQEVERIMSEK